MPTKKTIDEKHVIAQKRGNGQLRREVWIDEKTKEVTRYNLAYINHAIYGGDNGRVIGYDNAHGYHHKHELGKIEPVEFKSFEDTEARFEADFYRLKGSAEND